MPWATLFICDSVEFSSNPTPPITPSEVMTEQGDITGNGDHWSPAKISVQDLGANDRWLMVELEGNPTPQVFRTLKGWVVSADERSMTVEMKGAEPGALTNTTQKLRFDRAQSEDYWKFLRQIAMARMSQS